jgi:N-sulfoglucosamine sulfohydrolase
MSGLTFPAMKAAAATDPRIAARVEQYVNGVSFALYDFVNDPGQRTNLIHLPQHHERVERLTKLLSDYMQRTGDSQFGNLHWRSQESSLGLCSPRS